MALRNSVGLAQLVDDLGYHRYWVPEHHGMSGVASAAPARRSTPSPPARRRPIPAKRADQQHSHLSALTLFPAGLLE
ncbi:hypothetical protein [Nocardia amamiensis]|uniref:hypothetical protein n=1 Tax=Nocardia amamiensis TaxID=404578 RepID=UPI001E2FFA09|nr:hypothetical protein [Nocardia amamiensis]